MKKPINVGVSPRHVHLSKDDFHRLFGVDATLTRTKDLSQKGQYASEQFVTIATSIGRIENLRILGPFRDASQVELAGTEAVRLGLNPPVRDSGDHEDTPGITLIGPQSRVDLKQGVILAQRHVGILGRTFDRSARRIEFAVVTGTEESVVVRFPVDLATQVRAGARQREKIVLPGK